MVPKNKEYTLTRLTSKTFLLNLEVALITNREEIIMTKTALLTAIAAAAALASGSAFADTTASNNTMEKCHVVKAGKGMIVAGKADCKSTSHSCAGKNSSGDPASWIWVPTGDCVKVDDGDFSDLSQDVQAKIEGTDASGAMIG